MGDPAHETAAKEANAVMPTRVRGVPRVAVTARTRKPANSIASTS